MSKATGYGIAVLVMVFVFAAANNCFAGESQYLDSKYGTSSNTADMGQLVASFTAPANTQSWDEIVANNKPTDEQIAANEAMMNTKPTDEQIAANEAMMNTKPTDEQIAANEAMMNTKPPADQIAAGEAIMLNPTSLATSISAAEYKYLADVSNTATLTQDQQKIKAIFGQVPDPSKTKYGTPSIIPGKTTDDIKGVADISYFDNKGNYIGYARVINNYTQNKVFTYYFDAKDYIVKTEISPLPDLTEQTSLGGTWNEAQKK
jgi:hypothetical protein